MAREIIPLPPIEAVRGYTLQHIALYLDVSLPTVYSLIKKGRLPSKQIGEKRRIVPGSELIRFLNGEEPVLKGDPIDPRMSDIGRLGGLAGGLAKARKDQAA
jgi:excisionase family DNA binding protein